MLTWTPKRQHEIAESLHFFLRTAYARAITAPWRYTIDEDTFQHLYTCLLSDAKGANLLAMARSGRDLQNLVNHQSQYHLRNLVSRHHRRWNRLHRTEAIEDAATPVAAQPRGTAPGTSRWNGQAMHHRHSSHVPAGFFLADLMETLTDDDDLRQVAQLLLEGFSRQEVAGLMGLCSKTISRRIAELRRVIRQLAESN